jgi:Ca2+-binding RTX toxin-like protein
MILISASSAFAAGISMPASNLGEQSVSVTANDIKPSACNSIYLTNMISGSGTLTGTASNDLIIGSEAVDIIDGEGGDDCILGRNGNDVIVGGEGFDICWGGPGDDLFSICENEKQ